ncbi:MAG: GNAT family N-acetyltransferase [Pyrinomonadaceae bacterium]
MISYRRLKNGDFEELHQRLLEAFSDYYVEAQPSLEGLRRMHIIEGVNPDCSVGAFENGKMVGFTANAVGDRLGKLTAYDAGTGVIPAYRRRGISRGMFEFILPVLRRLGAKQYLLEVITENEPALRLYKNLGFRTHRTLSVLTGEKTLISENTPPDVEIKAIENPDWNLLESFLSYYPSWQNSIDSIKRCLPDESVPKIISGLYLKGKLIGYGIVFKNSGNVSQVAVAEEYRRRGFGKIILGELQKHTEKPLQFSNIDEEARGFINFLESNGFKVLTRQHEMLLKL